VTRSRSRWLLAGICVVYLLVVVPTSLMIPAYEANDESEHVIYTQRIVLHHHLPTISLLNGHESHQPPLYYALAPLWQRVLGIEVFEPQVASAGPVTVTPGRPTRALMLSHEYSPQQHAHAVSVHALRVLSILLGLGTVVLTFVAGLLAFGRPEVAAAAAAFVALLPKFQFVSATFTNDALTIMLSSLALVLALALLRRTSRGAAAYAAFGLGAVVGAAVITKLNAAPLLPVAAFALLLARRPLRERLLHVGLLGAGFVLVAGWWFDRNRDLYGDVLGRQVSREYLRERLPTLVDPVSLLDAERFLYFLPENLFRSAWYTGGWNQFIGPFALNLVLWMLVGVALFAWGKALITGSFEDGWFDGARRCGSAPLRSVASRPSFS